jgi:hypothetical protein
VLFNDIGHKSSYFYLRVDEDGKIALSEIAELALWLVLAILGTRATLLITNSQHRGAESHLRDRFRSIPT